MPYKSKRKRKAYHQGWWRDYYSDPVRKARHIASVRRNDAQRREVIRDWIVAKKLELGCRVCGFREHHAALDFAHRDRKTKEFNVGNAIRSGWSLARIQREVAKCDVVCANHHRIETFWENHRVLIPKNLRT